MIARGARSSNASLRNISQKFACALYSKQNWELELVYPEYIRIPLLQGMFYLRRRWWCWSMLLTGMVMEHLTSRSLWGLWWAEEQLLQLMIAMRSLMSLIPLTFFLSDLSLMNLVQFEAIYINLTTKFSILDLKDLWFISLAMFKCFRNWIRWQVDVVKIKYGSKFTKCWVN